MDINFEIKKHTDEIERVIETYLPRETGYQRSVIAAMRYSILAGGKRLRPMLMLETYRLFGGTTPAIEPFMAAMEMIHTYSLIHDDLPAMDDDDYRRGRPTCHKAYGEAMAILAGDGLLNYAFETALKSADMEPENPHIIPALRILANSSGLYGMLGGQVVDVESEGLPLDREKLDFIYALKTGALIRASMTIGAVMAGATDDEVGTIGAVADDVGLAFQIRDDILDVESDLATLGKPIGSDEKNAKTTYVTLRGLDAAKEDVERISGRAIETLEALPQKNEFLTELIVSLVSRKK